VFNLLYVYLAEQVTELVESHLIFIVIESINKFAEYAFLSFA